MPTSKQAAIDDVVLISSKRFTDDRGYFEETFNQRRFNEEVGLDVTFVQDNESLSRHQGTVRGLHYQIAPYGQGKLVRVMRGEILDVVVDIRPNSPTYLRHVQVHLSDRGGEQLWVPNGMAHGFCTLQPNTVVAYKVTDYYHPPSDRSLFWRDPRLGIDWPVTEEEAIVSAKDADGLSVAEMEDEDG